MHISIVIPAYNEEESLPELHQELSDVLSSMNRSYEIILIDDCSEDSTPHVIEELMQKDSCVKGIRLFHNSGKAGALEVGFAEAKGEIIMTLDADLQDDPKEIPRFVERIEQGADAVTGWKKDRLDTLEKRLFSKLMNGLASAVLRRRFHDMNCGFKAYQAYIAKELSLPGGLYRFIPHMIASRGYKVEELVIQHRGRRHGQSKFGVMHRLRGPIDLITVVFLHRFGDRPLHFFGGIGAFVGSIGVLIFGYFVGLWALGEALTVRPMMIIGFICLVVGVQIASVGLIGELIVYHRSKQDRMPSYRALGWEQSERHTGFSVAKIAERLTGKLKKMEVKN